MKTIKEAYDLSRFSIKFGDEHISLPLFLRQCADSFTNFGGFLLQSKESIKFRDLFIEGGIDALYKSQDPDTWVQFGLTIKPDEDLIVVHDKLYSLTNELIEKGVVENFFYMYKPPGLRIRFNMKPQERNKFRRTLLIHLNEWKEKKIIIDFTPGIYEAETHLFGGNSSMPYVHKLFTIDSLALLEFHTLSLHKKISDSDWLLSLVMLRDFFNQLGISGWEDIDVWDRIRQRTFRSLPDIIRNSTEFKTTAIEVRSKWQVQHSLHDMLSPRAKKIVKNYKDKIGPVISDWKNKYFNTLKAYIGVREAAAFFTIFHWNRAGISFPRQAIMTEALSAREEL